MDLNDRESAGTERLLLGVDCGTESIRVLAVDEHGGLYGDSRVAYPTSRPFHGWAEQSPHDWWLGLQSAIRELHDAGIDLARVAAIGVTATSSTVVLADESGEPVRPALLWMDVRATAEARTVEATGHSALTICPDGVSPEWGPVKVAWVAANEPTLFEQTAVVCEGGDWLIHQLSGEWSANIPAAVTAWFYDATERRWPLGLYRAAGFSDLIALLPKQVLAPGDIAGKITLEAAEFLGVPAGIPVVEGGIDSVSAMLALGVTGEKSAALITGSSNVILTQCSTRIRCSGVWGGYAHAAQPNLELVVGLHNAGSATAWLTNVLLDGRYERATLEADAARIAPGSDGLIALPDFNGNRTPFTEPRARGAFWGLSLSHRPAHLYRSILEGIAFATRQAFESMLASGLVIDEIRACGGATRSSLAMQIYADVLDRPIVTSAIPDMSAFGAAMATAIGTGIYLDFATASQSMNKFGRTYLPDEEIAGTYARQYDLFKRTYPALLPLMREMAEL